MTGIPDDESEINEALRAAGGNPGELGEALALAHGPRIQQEPPEPILAPRLTWKQRRSARPVDRMTLDWTRGSVIIGALGLLVAIIGLVFTYLALRK